MCARRNNKKITEQQLLRMYSYRANSVKFKNIMMQSQTEETVCYSLEESYI